MNTPVDQIKASTLAEYRMLRADLDNALAAHKWFMFAGFVIGVVVGAWLTHVL